MAGQTSPDSFFKEWLPGVLSKEQTIRLCKEGFIDGVTDLSSIDHSSIDLTLDEIGYALPKGSLKPFGDGYYRVIHSETTFFEPLPKQAEYRLEPNCTYVFRLEQKLGRKISSSPIYGQATAKSSIGRVDVLARLIVDGMDCYEAFTPEGVRQANGDMFVEITPLTFPVVVKKGVPITQLRLFYGRPEQCELRGKEVFTSTLQDDQSDGYLRVDLTDVDCDKEKGCAFRAEKTIGETAVAIKLWKEDALPDPRKHWQLSSAINFNNSRCLEIEKERFYILRSKERMALGKGVAVYCMAIDETIGEMRIHYAGFVHPYFGLERADGLVGTPLIFEVRGHDVKVILTDGEKLAKLKFYRMSEDCSPPEKKKIPDPYDNQKLQLSKLFAPWTKQ